MLRDEVYRCMGEESMWNPYDFTGKKMIVTGATSGIGRAAAIKLAEQGATVHIIGRNEEKLLDTIRHLKGEHHRYYIKDFAEPGNYQSLFDDIISDGKKIDGLVYSAGVAKILPLSTLNYKNMNESMIVNLYSMVELVSMLSKKKYHMNTNIVVVSSIAAEYPGKCQGVYAASKAAINAMVQSLAMELSKKNIRINSVMPASTNTPMLQEANDNRGQESVHNELKKQLLGLEEPEDIADIIMFLLSDASRMITGRAIYADAGYLNF